MDINLELKKLVVGVANRPIECVTSCDDYCGYCGNRDYKEGHEVGCLWVRAVRITLQNYPDEFDWDHEYLFPISLNKTENGEQVVVDKDGSFTTRPTILNRIAKRKNQPEGN